MIFLRFYEICVKHKINHFLLPFQRRSEYSPSHFSPFSETNTRDNIHTRQKERLSISSSMNKTQNRREKYSAIVIENNKDEANKDKERHNHGYNRYNVDLISIYNNLTLF